jgi:hypothetical protein
METLLHYVWKHKLYASSPFVTQEGHALEIIDPGTYNTHAGADFFNAKIKLDNRIWVGNVEIHTHSSDWYKHKHEKDKAYNPVILHVVEHPDIEEVRTESGRAIPQWVMKIPENIKENYHFLLNTDEAIPCLSRINEIDGIYLTDWKNALLTERLEKKTQSLFQLLDACYDDWNEVFYICLSRNFGFGINNDAFERLAKSLPLKYILKHQDSGKQVEALFLGQAGLLDKDSIDDDYYRSLREEYQFLKTKYKLQALESHIFKSLRIRPGNFPHIKIVQLAGFVRKKPDLFSSVLTTVPLKDLIALFTTEIDDYWLTHYHFEKSSVKKPKQLGLSAIHILLINTVVPILFAYGKKKNQELFVERALDLLEAIKPENNFIVTAFTRAGITATHAGDTQALIQLKREYCEQKKCMYCRIGHRLLSKGKLCER